MSPISLGRPVGGERPREPCQGGRTLPWKLPELFWSDFRLAGEYLNRDGSAGAMYTWKDRPGHRTKHHEPEELANNRLHRYNLTARGQIEGEPRTLSRTSFAKKCIVNPARREWGRQTALIRDPYTRCGVGRSREASPEGAHLRFVVFAPRADESLWLTQYNFLNFTPGSSVFRRSGVATL